MTTILSRALLKRHSVLPGFDLALGFTLLYVGLVVLIPLSAAFLKTFTLGWQAFVDATTTPRVLASYRLTFGASFLAALLNAAFGLVVAWVLVRYRFPGRRIVDALVDLPFALLTAVAGIALTALYAERGWLGRWLPFKVSYTPLGVWVALVHRPAVRRAHAAAGAGGHEPRARGSGRDARREPPADLREGRAAGADAGAPDRLRARLRARSASTARSSSSPATCRWSARSRRS